MSFKTENRAKFDDLKNLLKPENRSQITLKANGGNSLLFCYPPEDEKLYLEKAKQKFKDKSKFININDLLVKYIDSIGWDEFREFFENYSSTPSKIFSNESEADFFSLIINEILMADADDKIPFLIRTGCLFGTGIGNVNIMEDERILSLTKPIVVFYPAKIENEELYFLNFYKASKYRCRIIN